jgi:transposase
MSTKHYRPWNPEQLLLFPPDMRDALEEGHLVFRILDVVRTLDISCITDRIQEKDPRGTRPYHPQMMLALLIYAYCSGVYSSRKIAAGTYDIIPFRVITADQHPHFTVINEFRLENLEAFVDLFLQVLKLCDLAGLLDLKHVSLDGSKVRANASKHKAMSYGRMQVQMERLEREIRELSARAEEIDNEEDALYGKGRDAHDIPDELKRREGRRKRIDQAKRELEQEARAARERELRKRAGRQRSAAETEPDPAERKRKRTRARKAEEEADRLAAESDEGTASDDAEESDLPSHQVKTTTEGKPAPKAQRNFTDPDSRIMKRDGSYMQGFNCQAVVDGANQIIVAEAVTNQAPDQEHLPPMMDRVRQNIGETPEILSADTGYMSEANVAYCENNGIDAHLAVGRKPHAEGDEATDNDKEAWRRMREKLGTAHGSEVYARRKAIVEPVFGHAKEARGFRRFSLRGLEKVRAEWTMICLCSNLLKLVRYSSVEQLVTVS